MVFVREPGIRLRSDRERAVPILGLNQRMLQMSETDTKEATEVTTPATPAETKEPEKENMMTKVNTQRNFCLDHKQFL